MPKYVFECQECNVRFERVLKMAAHTSHECPSCTDPAPRVLDGQNFGFGFAPSKGAPANSGVHDQDYPTADKVVGRSANQRWGEYKAREVVKNQARKEGGTHALIRKTTKEYIDYEPMTPNGLGARKKLTKAAEAAVQAQKPTK